MKKCIRNIVILVFALLLISCSENKNDVNDQTELPVSFDGDASIEVGSPFAGIAFHHSSALPQRISFYYPVANSIDASTDFWHRDTSYIMELGLITDGTEKEQIDSKNFAFQSTPYYVNFSKDYPDKQIQISYHFAKSKPAFVLEIELINTSDAEHTFELYTGMITSLRTSHTFKHITNAQTQYDSSLQTLITRFDEKQTGKANLFISNVGEKASSFSTIKDSSDKSVTGVSGFFLNQELGNNFIGENVGQSPVARFVYSKKLSPGESLKVTQIIGTAKSEELSESVSYLRENYENEIAAYESSIENKIALSNSGTSCDSIIDHSILWAKAMLEANKHYLDGEFVPMPCPAEYNFYFTHDVLVSDLATVYYDLPRVRNDLLYIMKHAKDDFTIPHAYYWKDSLYMTEYADNDNWNNFWIIIVSASYLRHSGDSTLLKELYPYLTKSLENALKTLGDDFLMWSYRPDWWDIGKLYGAKTYMTALAYKAIQDYSYITAMIEQNTELLSLYDEMSRKMKTSLNNNLWSSNQNYLINYYEEAKPDTHYYIGSFLASYFGLLSEDRNRKQLQTAKSIMVDTAVGIYNAYPMDFHELGEYLGFSGNEAGDKYYYFNGGIWSQGNAWYALALIEAGKNKEAYEFVKNVMTVKGIMNGPNGQPAMYEVRNGNKQNPAMYGKVDKPTFMWAGAWYLYTLYHLQLIDELTWNVSFNPYILPNQNSMHYNITINGILVPVQVTGSGEMIQQICYDNLALPSSIIPLSIKHIDEINITMGMPETPILTKLNSALMTIHYKNNTLECNAKSFVGNKDYVEILSPLSIETILIDESTVENLVISNVNEDIRKITFSFKHTLERGHTIKVLFSEK